MLISFFVQEPDVFLFHDLPLQLILLAHFLHLPNIGCVVGGGLCVQLVHVSHMVRFFVVQVLRVLVGRLIVITHVFGHFCVNVVVVLVSVHYILCLFLIVLLK